MPPSITEAAAIFAERERHHRLELAKAITGANAVRSVQSALINLVRNRSEDLKELEEDIADLGTMEDWGEF